MTIENFNQHEKRVVDELTDLLEKSRKLDFFIYENQTFTTLIPTEQNLLKEQSKIMHAYIAVLCNRIALFTKKNEGKVS